MLTVSESNRSSINFGSESWQSAKTESKRWHKPTLEGPDDAALVDARLNSLRVDRSLPKQSTGERR